MSNWFYYKGSVSLYNELNRALVQWAKKYSMWLSEEDVKLLGKFEKYFEERKEKEEEEEVVEGGEDDSDDDDNIDIEDEDDDDEDIMSIEESELGMGILPSDRDNNARPGSKEAIGLPGPTTLQRPSLLPLSPTLPLPTLPTPPTWHSNSKYKSSDVITTKQQQQQQLSQILESVQYVMRVRPYLSQSELLRTALSLNHTPLPVPFDTLRTAVSRFLKGFTPFADVYKMSFFLNLMNK